MPFLQPALLTPAGSTGSSLPSQQYHTAPRALQLARQTRFIPTFSYSYSISYIVSNFLDIIILSIFARAPVGGDGGCLEPRICPHGARRFELD